MFIIFILTILYRFLTNAKIIAISQNAKFFS